MVLLNPNKLNTTEYQDEITKSIMTKTINWFENKGRLQLKKDHHERTWYRDFLDFLHEEQIFANLLTPPQYGDPGTRWDTFRNNQMSEILGFYGLSFWYTWQVSILGLGPVWISHNEKIKNHTAKLLQDGGIFGFGLSEKEHGADIYSSDLTLTKQEDGTYLANGNKYYIGNGNEGALISIFGKMENIGEVEDKRFGKYVFFPVSTQHEKYEVVKNVIDSQMFVAEYKLNDYPILEDEILAKGQEAWNMALNTVNIGKFNLGWGSIGICTHAFYEAIDHATHRILYGHPVSDFPHIQQYFVQAYARLVAMKTFAQRATDYMRAASPEDRRYLLFNPLVKCYVTSQGEEVIDLLWDIIAAKGYEKDQYFENATKHIRMLPKLEGTVHVNMALVVKFVENFFFNKADLPEVPKMDQPINDDFLFNQPAAKGLRKIVFHDFNKAFENVDIPNVLIFKEQILLFEEFLKTAAPTKLQSKDFDFVLIFGFLFTQIVYGELILENQRYSALNEDLINQIFEFIVQDFSKYAVKLYSKPTCTETQMNLLLQMVKKPALNEEGFAKVWQNFVFPLKNSYTMQE
ncbi:acyl-CoA dehydrogenase family protein [Candidatus Lokiarchaeum ossiferum]|uniref:acyl-CoA dehydrogenase family protein n=1 Tax=Candidatus Lokiarchaeum ossiferum TaxID=2951803 RepID=UPI00352E020E